MRLKHLKVKKLTDEDRDALIRAYELEFGEEFKPLFFNCMVFLQRELLKDGVAMNTREYILEILRRVSHV